MSFESARRLAFAQPSATLALNAKARAMVAQGLDVVSFAAGEPDFDTPQHVKQAMVDALDQGFTKYTATGGIPELKNAIVEKLKRDNQLEYNADSVLVTVGGKQALFNAFEALLSPGDEVVIFSPYWVSYPEMVRLSDGVPVIVPTLAAEGFVPKPEALANALTAKTRAVVFNSPSNPTGAVIPAEVLRQMGEILRSHSCFVLTDDIYEKLIYLGTAFQNILNLAPHLKERTVLVNGFSKAYAMTGLRLGYAAGPASVIASMQLVQDQSTSNATSIVQKAGVAALNGTQAPLADMHREYAKRRVLMADGLSAIEGISCPRPDGAFYCFADVRPLLDKKYEGQAIATSERLSQLLLEKALVAAVPGAPFGAEGCIRFSFATSEQAIQKGLARVKAFVAGLRRCQQSARRLVRDFRTIALFCEMPITLVFWATCGFALLTNLHNVAEGWAGVLHPDAGEDFDASGQLIVLRVTLNASLATLALEFGVAILHWKTGWGRQALWVLPVLELCAVFCGMLYVGMTHSRKNQ